MFPWPSLSLQPSLFRNTCKLQKTHHLVVAQCGLVNLAQIPKHIVQMLQKPTEPSSPMPLMIFLQKSVQVHCGLYEVSPLLLGDYGYDVTKSRVWDGNYSHHIILIHMWCTLPSNYELWQWRCHITTNYLEKPYGRLSMWIRWNT